MRYRQLSGLLRPDGIVLSRRSWRLADGRLSQLWVATVVVPGPTLVSTGSRLVRPRSLHGTLRALRWEGRSSSRGCPTGSFEESPDITGQGGRVIDPGKPAGKCHRNKPPMSAVPRERLAGKGEMVR